MGGRKFFILFFSLFPFLAPLLAYGQQPLIQVTGNGEINWSEQVIRASGSGAPHPDASNIAAARLGAERAAKADAMRNILEVVKGVRINSQTTVKDALTQSDQIRTQVQGIIRGAKVINTRYFSDGAVEVTLEIPLAGALSQSLLTPSSFGTQPVPKAGNPAYSGVIFDCRGLNLQPALAPRVLDEDGREVYGAAFAAQEWALKYGVAGYLKNNMETALKNERVAPNPLVIKAIKAAGPGNTDLVISNADAQVLRDTSRNLSFLEQCRVLIVVD